MANTSLMSPIMCRVCMKSDCPLFSPYEPSPGGYLPFDLIASLAQVEINRDDGLPQMICSSCLNDLEITNKLITTCKDSDSQLRQRLSADKGKFSPHEYHVIEAINEVEVINESEESDDAVSVPDAPIELLDIDDIIEEETFDSDEPIIQDDINTSFHVDDLILTDPVVQTFDGHRTQCCGCAEKFDTFEQLELHSNECHLPERAISGPVPVGLIECTICYQLFSGTSYLDSRHQLPAFRDRLVSAEFPEVVQCCSCETLCSGSEEMRQHSSLHLDEKLPDDPMKPFECEFCFKRFNLQTGLVTHQRFSFSYKKYVKTKRRGCAATKKRNEIERKTAGRKCCGCSAKFPSEDSLKQHSQMHHELYRRNQPDRNNPFECQICFRQFPTAARLEQHKMVPYARVHQCKLCERSFVSALLLARHVQSHSGKPREGGRVQERSGPEVQCDECGQMLKNKHYLKRHRKCQHSQEKVFSCSICHRKFKWKHTLSVHLRVHTNERPFSCSYCERKFAHLTDKNRHELTHSGQFPLRCSVCDKGFPAGRRKQLDKHMQLHEAGEDYPLRCRFCDRTFTKLFLRDRHQAAHVTSETE
uniref:Zinc finger protein 624 n=1 Tax=Culex pipiens TaxID=7175 RepID=A0A8D8NY47_CULPI